MEKLGGLTMLKVASVLAVVYEQVQQLPNNVETYSASREGYSL